MAYVQYGETDWDEAANNNKSAFYKLKDGEDDDNAMRVITKPHKFGTHHIKFPDDPNKKYGGGRRVRCAGQKNGCKLCEIAKAQDPKTLNEDYEAPDWAKGLVVNKMKPRWYLGIIPRKDAKPIIAKTLEIGGLIRGRLKELSNNKKWGDPRNYDITIIVKGGIVPAEFYSVDGDPDGRGPLSEEDTKLAAAFDVAGMAEKCNPVSHEDVQKSVESYREWINKAVEEAGKKKTATPAKSADKAKAKEPEESDDGGSSDASEADFNFKSTKE